MLLTGEYSLSDSLNNKHVISVFIFFHVIVGYLDSIFNTPLKFKLDKIEGRF
jgi:hypothetical protein